jgi:membrane-associated phospholipid phosphatase
MKYLARHLHPRPFMQPTVRPRRRRSGKSATRASVAALAAFGLTALIDEPTALDVAAYQYAARGYNRGLELVQRPLEMFGLPGFYIPATILLSRAMRRHRGRGGDTIVSAAVAGWLVLRLTRVFIHRPRPPRPPGRKPKRESTFPSGHTTGLTSLAIVAAHVLEREQILTPAQARLLRFGLPLLIGADRIYVREHWMTDVLGGWALGTSVALACVASRNGDRRSEPA